MRRDKKYNYVYKIKFSTGKFYIGVRSCDCELHEDDYMGSAFNIPDNIKETGIKCILSLHSTRKEADLEEIRLHNELNVKNNDLYYNECNASSTKFFPSKEAIKKSSETRKGRTAETHDYIKEQVRKKKLLKGDNLTDKQKKAYKDPIRNAKLSAMKGVYVGENRTPKQKIKDIAMLGVPQGPNPKKGHTGVKHPRYKPWWYITPEGLYVEVLDSVRNYVNNNPNIFPVPAKSVSRYLAGNSNPNYCNSKSKGWKFGHLINLNTATN